MNFGDDSDRFVLYTRCDPCVHYLGDETCAAFPDGIPKEIRNGENYHLKPYPGDHGIRFELDETIPNLAPDKPKPEPKKDKKLIRFQLPANPTAKDVEKLSKWIKGQASNANPTKKED